MQTLQTPQTHPSPLRTERGASAVEYGLLLAGIAALIAAAVFVFGIGVDGLFDDTCSTVASTAGGSCG